MNLGNSLAVYMSYMFYAHVCVYNLNVSACVYMYVCVYIFMYVSRMTHSALYI
jgi:hypothetical protein